MSNLPLATGLLRAELLKLKRGAIGYVLLLCILVTILGVFLSHLWDAHHMVKLNDDPWDRYFHGARAIFNLFIVVPYLVLIVSAVIFIEQRANAWKYLYALPPSRGAIYFAKIGMLLLLFATSILLLLLGVVVSGYFLHLFRPEYEFNYYTPDYAYLLREMGHCYLASLGLIAWQYWLSMRFKNILAPLGIGVFGYVFGIILSVTGQKLSIYWVYALPMLGRDLDMFRNEYVADSFLPGLNNVELHSLIYFAVFLLLGYWAERRREVVS